ncbi:mediator of RNA polymerase II transcription subunit 8-like [Vicia villosa]|uniref:mediator of RNA polymerase II transcription subunit 8-like n=1 Tax=Vicia villosa TaxID=3911 RepID=UPI00273CDC0B|nr:mediator of RNA polymerase II transcription subunit 8-like [Vicia villosa]XP_058762143.1 mediator of RNA polymerase II transcription subunit 8-like [Vicia villosa]XP_058762144.1 mediator of RNA polymerase II transcription subunit 8-like [Vicia villosa]XP_058762145.1 mediator of RNA polymerase II transcription subunit 8-like [Vicia villosa]
MEGELVQQPQQQQERLNQAVQQQLNLEQVKTRAISLFKAISRILEDFDAYGRTNTTPKWQDILGQYSMVNLELFNIVDDIKKVSKAFIVYPKNVNADNATILPVMLSTKLLPEMETEDTSKRDQLLQGMQNLPIATQIDKLKARIDMIAAACEGAEKVLADTRKAYCFGTRQGPSIAPTLDKGQAAKIQEQENLLRAAVNVGEGLRLPVDQRHITSSLPMHLADAFTVNETAQPFPDGSNNNVYMKNTPLSSNNMGGQNTMLQTTGPQLLGRSAASPSAATSATSFDNTTASPIPYANSPRSSTNMMNTPSPQQQTSQMQQQQPTAQQQQQQRQKLMQQLPQQQQQQLLAQQQQQFRQSAMQGMGQMQGQHQMQFSPQLGHQQFQSRQQLSSAHMQHSLGQNQLNQGNQMTRLSQFSGHANNALFSAAQTTPNTQMIPNISAGISSQSHLPRMQYGLSGNNPQRSHPSQMLSDQMFNMGSGNPGGMMSLQQQQQQQQQHNSQGSFGGMASNAQNLQSGMMTLQNAQQNHPNFSQQRQQNQQ